MSEELVIIFIFAIGLFVSYWFGNWRGTKEARAYLEEQIKKEPKKGVGKK